MCRVYGLLSCGLRFRGVGSQDIRIPKCGASALVFLTRFRSFRVEEVAAFGLSLLSACVEGSKLFFSLYRVSSLGFRAKG